jgi:signal transduction histidine kinase
VFAAIASFYILEIIMTITTYSFDFESISDQQFFILLGVTLVGFAILLGTIFIIMTSILINSFISRRIKQLEIQTKEVIKGDYSAIIDINHKDEIGSLAKTYQIMLDALKSNEYLNKNFIRNISHEMKTPLTAIYGYASLIEEENDQNKIKQYSEIVKYESKRLATLSVDLLKVSELDSKQIIPKVDIYNLSEQLREVIIVTQPTWEKKGIEFELNLQEVNIKSNKALMHIVIMNLVSNAIKYTKEQHPITISLYEENNEVTLSISNPGTIQKKDMEHIFSLFYTTDNDKSKRSNGVGLTLARRILHRLSSTITCSSSNDTVTFVIQLNNGLMDTKK